ncbi:MAG: YajG family lipoprotein [Burkholderiales bacterium]
MNIRFRLATAVLIALPLFAGCALKPQYLQVDPEIKAPESQVGAGVQVGLKVSDVRTDQKLGEVGDPNNKMVDVRVAKDPSPAIYLRVERALSKMGFTIVPYSDGMVRTLQVEVRELTLQSVKKALVFDTELRAVIGGIATNGPNRHDRQLNVRTRKESAAPPFEKDSTALVNTAVSQALEDLVADDNVLGVLTR